MQESKSEGWEKLVEADLSKVCRLCLKGEEVLCPIFGTSQVNGNGPGVGLPFRIMACAKIKVYEGDGLPTQVCTTCLNQVNRSYQFKLMCERSDTTLRGGECDEEEAQLDGNEESVDMPENSDTESDSGDTWDMTKFTPEVIIKEENDVNGGEGAVTNGAPESPVFSPINAVEALLRPQTTHIKVEHKEVMRANGPVPELVALSTGLGGLTFQGGSAPLGLLAVVAAAQQQVAHQPSELPQTLTVVPSLTATPTPQDLAFSRSRRCRSGEKAFKCRQCNKSYSFSSALSRHKAVHNTALRPHVCNICKKGFTQLEKLLRHQRTHVLEAGGVVCETCNEPFKTTSAYQKHRIMGCSSTEGQELKEDKQEAEPNENTGPAEEVKVEPKNEVDKKESPPTPKPRSGRCRRCSQNPCSCEEPPRAGRNSGKGRPEFQCKVCQKCFATRGSLEVHSTIHTGVRPFVCTVCSQSFRHKVNLMEHFQRKHSQVRPYICDVCASRFVTKQELVRHYRKHIGD